MNCPHCQASNEDTATFCRNCGNRLGQPAPRANPPQQASGSGAYPGYQGQQAQPGYQAPSDPAGYQAPPGAASYPAAPSAAGYPPAGYQGSPASGYSAPPGTPGYQNQPAGRSPGSAFRFDLRRLSRVDQVVGGASLVLFISMFLPWFGVSGYSQDATTSHGYLVIVLILALVLIGYLLLRSGWDEFPVRLPIAHAPLLLVGTGLQFLLVLIGFLIPASIGGYHLGREFGAYIGLIASVVAAAPVIVPAVRSWQDMH